MCVYIGVHELCVCVCVGFFAAVCSANLLMDTLRIKNTHS